jgi:O-6-methylguanine DNA methyltransferase
MQTIHVARLRVPLLGVIHVAANSHGVLRVWLSDDGDGLAAELRARYPEAQLKKGGGLSVDAGRAIKRYLAGGPDPRLPVVLPSDGFAARVWRQLARIPHGQVRSYARVAKDIRKPLAARAVGQACGRNPVPLIIPCHRVVASDRKIGGFTGGLDIKRKLLALEGVNLSR